MSPLPESRVQKGTAAPASLKEPVKHRACDECRTRKLACTKEPDGCERCKREGISCHYSPQKTMGRPRKRHQQREIDVIQASAASPARPNGDFLQDMGSTWQQDPIIMTNDAPMDPDFNGDMNFLDFLGPGFISEQPLPACPLPHAMPIERGLLNINIDFDSYSPQQPVNSITPGSTPPDHTYHLVSTPSLTSHGTFPWDPNQDPNPATAPPTAAAAAAPSPPPPPSRPSFPCACLSNIYVALSSLHALPKDVTAAMQVARSACHAAHDAMQCPVCAPPIHEPVRHPMATFTTMMTLSSLLPCIADAYKRILDMIDAETLRAIMSETKSPLFFSLAAHGGIWGTPAHHAPRSSSSSSTTPNNPNPNPDDAAAATTEQEPLCAASLRRFDKQDMDPAQWRLTLRALLKVDVYGLSRDDSREAFTQVGLRDLVARMEETSRRRHAQVDQMLDAGLPAPVGLAGLPVRHSGQSVPSCRRVIAVAREAVDNIVIP